MKTLRELHEQNAGKVSDKWSLYLDEYERVLRDLRERPVRLFEIGVQNGGSLETWSRYFPAATKLVGCDIDPACGKLAYDDPRIAVVVGDANLDETARAVTAHSATFDVIIDDGSHRSSDIVRSFARWFPRLADGGVYIVEDLHCSYWRSHEGGLHDPYSSLAFMRSLSDVVAHEHWGLERTRRQELAPFEQRYGVTFDEHELEHVHSVELANSMAIVRKAPPEANVLGRRVVGGNDASVSTDPIGVRDTLRSVPAQQDAGALLDQLTSAHMRLNALEHELARCEQELAKLHTKVANQADRQRQLTHELEQVLGSTSWRMTRPLRVASKLVLGHWRHHD